MKDRDKGQGQLIEELERLRQRVAELEAADAKRKQAEEEVHTKEQLFRALVEYSSDIIVMVNREGVIIYENPAIEQAIGLKPEERLGASVFERVHPDDIKIVMDAFKELSQSLNNAMQRAELRLRHKDGTWRVFEATGSNLVHGSTVESVIINLRDITERKRAEEALRESEEKLRILFETAGIGITVTDMSGAIIDINEAVLELTGFSCKEELLGRNGLDFIAERDRDRAMESMMQTIQHGQGASIELTLLRKDGSEFDGETSANVLHDSSGNPVGLVCVEKDITERRRAEEALRESEGKFRILSDQALMGIIILQDESFVYVNDCAAAIMEVPAERIANWSPGDYAKLIHPDDLAFVMEQGRKKQAGEKDAVIHYDWRMVTPGGNLKWIEMWSKSILFRGRIADMLTMIDITGRKRAEEKLREARDYQEKLIDHANAPVIVWRPDFKITQFNRAFEHLTGYKRAKIINKHLRMLFPEESREVSMKKIDDTLIGESWESVEIPILCKDGTVRLVLWNSSNIYGDDGVTVIATIAQGQDITDAKRAEEALRESEEMARSMLDNAAMGIYLLQDKKFLYVNPTFEKIIGYSSEELVGQEAINYVHPDDRDTVRTKAVENIKGISALPYEFRALRKDGKQIWVMERVASIKYKGRRAVIASFMETTEHRKAEVELERAYEELKTAHEHMVQSEKLRAMGEMASGIAHDFNNMLAVILGRTHLVIDDVKDDKVRKGIQIIEQAALDAAKTVKRLQDFSRIRVEHAFESLDVNQVVGGVLKMLEPRVIELEQTRRIVIKVEEDLREVASVSGDAAELREALLNILFNAIDAMPTGGKLTVKSEQEGDWVEITIKDTGVGMPDKVKSRMFEPFFTTKDAKGSGLGLSVTYGIIARHGGIIKFDSAVGIGTSFYIRLPVAVEEVKKVERQRKAIVAKGAMILAVDDEPEVLRALTLTLEYLGHWAKGFTGGAEAVKAFKDGNYDLVITDLGMPEVSGWDVARAVKDIKPDVAVLLITGWEIELDEEQRTYVDGVISKPFSRDSISSAIARVFPARKRSRRKKSG